MLASAATARVSTRSRDARQRERYRDQLDQGEQEHRVDQQRDGRHHAEHAVEDEQEQDRQRLPAPSQKALIEGLLAERGRDLGPRRSA